MKLSNFKLLSFSLLIILALYLTLGGYDLKNQNSKLLAKNKELASSQKDLSNELLSVNTQISDTQNKLNDLTAKLDGYDSQIASLQSKIAKQILGAQVVKEVQYVETEPKVITETVYKTKTNTVYKTNTVTKEIEKNQASVIIEGLGSYKVDLQANDTALVVLLRAGAQNNFEIKYQEYSFGAFVSEIGGIAPQGNQYWAFYYNGKYSMVGASAQEIVKDDTIYWKLESF